MGFKVYAALDLAALRAAWLAEVWSHIQGSDVHAAAIKGPACHGRGID